MELHRSTGPSAHSTARRRVGTLALLRALARVIDARPWVRHRPTWGQLRAMAWLDGYEPCSYLLDPEQNLVPELPFGDERQLGTEGLCFTCRLPDGRVTEMVALRHGGAFDLLGA